MWVRLPPGQLKGGLATQLIQNNFNLWPEIDRLYSAPESVWILVRISSQSNQAEILADMIFLRDQIKALLDRLGESWLIELTAIDRKIYMRREAVEKVEDNAS